MMESALRELRENPDFQILARVPATLTTKPNVDPKCFVATIIDLETMGLDAKQHEIIEIGLLSFSFSSIDGILGIVATYNELHDPGKPIPDEVTKVTGIRYEDVKGRAIDWSHVSQLLQNSHLIICHNSSFDRNFLELQTPGPIQSIIQGLPFACTIKDIDWKDRGIESSKLDYINWKLGFFYDGHRAINDCWATLNVLLQAEGVFDELKSNVRKKEVIICAKDASFDKKDLLKARSYRWSDGSARMPKGWWICIANTLLEEEKRWLDEEIYGYTGASNKIPQADITARNRYSFRAEALS